MTYSFFGGADDLMTALFWRHSFKPSICTAWCATVEAGNVKSLITLLTLWTWRKIRATPRACPYHRTVRKWHENFRGQIRGYKNFANKLWNIARFILTFAGGTELLPEFKDYLKSDVELREKGINSWRHYGGYGKLRFYLAGEKLYHYVWHRLADEILEESKVFWRRASRKPSYRAGSSCFIP